MEFKRKVQRLRRHFEQFNVDVSELCQWLMGFRPGGKRAGEKSQIFWNFFLEPEKYLKEEDKVNGDARRLKVFRVAAGFETTEGLSGILLSTPISLEESVSAVAALPLTTTAKNLFARLAAMNPAHQLVLLKAAAEWIVARYLRGCENWERQHEEWAKEKIEWEKDHPELTGEARNEFNQIFKDIGIRLKRPRVCSWERLKESRDNCEYAGERIRLGGVWKSHAALCVKYKKFFDSQAKDQKNKKNLKDHFVNCANDYLQIKKNNQHLPKDKVTKAFREKYPQAKWFPDIWTAYLNEVGINESTILNQYGGRLPHCVEFGADNNCEFNQHTELCRLYKTRLDQRPDLQQREDLYREWRKEYLSGPNKPSFRYPSSKDLPLPKIFGRDFFRVDFDSSILELRLDDMPEGQFLRFGFKPWPKDYRPQPHDTEITSVHVNFIGTRARAGFRFLTPHQTSRFSISQDELDYLRSRKYPRRAQDQKFLDEARDLLIESFEPRPSKKKLKMLAVDLGTSGAGAALFEGKKFIKKEPLRIVKLDKLYESYDKKQEGKERVKRKGLSKDHVGLHLEAWSKEAKKIAEKRQDTEKKKKVEIRGHDMRGLGLHTGWMLRDWARLNASQIIKIAEHNDVDLIVFESMRGEKQPGYDELKIDEKQRKAFWSYGKIRRKVVEKAVERGMRVITVPKFKSSQVCCKCGREQTDIKRWRVNKTKRHEFQCEFKGCNNKTNSDENAARVLGRVFWGEITLAAKEEDGA